MGAMRGAFRSGIDLSLDAIGLQTYRDSHVYRAGLMAAFDVSVDQTSADLNRFLGMAPDNVVFIESTRANVRGDRFELLCLTPYSAGYLPQVRSVCDGTATQQGTRIGELPAFDTMRDPAQGIGAGNLRAVL